MNHEAEGVTPLTKHEYSRLLLTVTLHTKTSTRGGKKRRKKKKKKHNSILFYFILKI